MTQKPRLWTRDFTIITLGTVVSMLGNAVSGFAISLLVLDYTGSVFLYALYMVVYNLPKVVMPLVAGPYLDSYSRKRAIYTLDFISAGLYTGIFLLLKAGLFSYGPFLALCFFIGCIDSSYEVAYESLYPTLIPEGCFSRAYSISSLIYPFAVIMVPVASFVYELVGLEPLFAFNAATFFVAACFETRIRGGDTHIRTEHGTMLREFREGLAYLKGEPGLMVIAVYFFFSMLVGSGGSALWLPYFRSAPGLGLETYVYVMAANVLGRLAGGVVHYRVHLKARHKFAVALTVYASISFLEGGFVFAPKGLMLLMCFVSGFLAVNSYNIRISATQSYVPDSCRARFNGVFLMFTTLGSVIGQLAAGALAEFLPIRGVIAGLQLVGLVGVFTIIWPGRSHVKSIYNREVQ